MTDRFIVAGSGYTGRRLAPRLSEYGAVRVIARTPRSLAGLSADRYDLTTADLGTAEAATDTDGAAIVYLAPPPPDGDRDATLEAFLGHGGIPARIVYASTSGVYGDCGGALVAETRPAAPQTARAIRRAGAERALSRWCAEHGAELVILRVAGIYGPDRLPLRRIQKREPVLREKDAGPGNRIHVDDLVETCVQAAIADAPPGVVNVCDGNHASNTQFTKLVAREAQLPPPPEIGLDQARRVFTPMRWSFIAESRRLDNTRLRERLGVRLRYADLTAGVRASLPVRAG